MTQERKALRRLVRGALFAVLCAALAPISYGEVQFRISEALTILPLLMPEAVPGLFVGCLIANLIGGAGILDIVFGSLATLIAGLLTYAMRKLPAWAALLPVVVVNGLVVGWVLNAAYGTPLLLGMGSVALGQAVVCYVLGCRCWRCCAAACRRSCCTKSAPPFWGGGAKMPRFRCGTGSKGPSFFPKFKEKTHSSPSFLREDVLY